MSKGARPLVLHVISNLEIGGAEQVLAEIATGASDYRHHVVSLGSVGKLGQRLDAQKVDVTALGMSRGRISLRGIFKLWLTVRTVRPNLIQTWMYHADLLGGVVGRLAGVPVIWNLRKASLDWTSIKKSTLAVMLVCGVLSWVVPKRIIVCSSSSPKDHRRFGYRTEVMEFVPNGVDLKKFRPRATNRETEKSNLGLDPRLFAIGMFVRFHPQKDIFGFLDGLKILRAEGSEYQVLFAGQGMNRANHVLVEAIDERGLTDTVSLGGFLEQPGAALAALDLMVLSSSSGEGFPNILVEAMASGVPCVATDTGESRRIVGDTGWIVEPSNPVALARAISNAIYCGRDGMIARAKEARIRVSHKFTTKQMVSTYQAIYSSLV